MILIDGLTDEIAAVDGGCPVLAQVNLNQGIDDQQAGITLVTLYVQVVQVFGAIGVARQVNIFESCQLTYFKRMKDCR